MTEFRQRVKLRHQRLALVVAIVLLLFVVFGRAIQREILVHLMIRGNAPDTTVLQELVDQSSNPATLLLRLWESRKIPHRLFVMRHLNNVAAASPDLVQQMHPVLRDGVRDADLSVREIALSVLATENHPELINLAQRQLQDVDPETRLLGLQYLRAKGDQKRARAVAPMLDDPEPRVAVAAANALRMWTGNDFGVRAHLLIAHEDQAGMTQADPAKLQIATRGLQQWKLWWKLHEQDFPLIPDPVSARPPVKLPVKDFSLEDLTGRRVQLSGFRGKVVLLNFWTTWCTACGAEIPDLIELQQRRPELVILGISLDGLPDEHDHGQAGVNSERSGPAGQSGQTDITIIRERVHQFTKAKGINYRVLLNPTGELGARFNGYELPTNILIDREGFIRRRFLGSRAPSVLEAMINDIGTNQVPTR
jgi:thiol-disulfide isomerase/thioredoxin